jgi:hypothetical protein
MKIKQSKDEHEGVCELSVSVSVWQAIDDSSTVKSIPHVLGDLRRNNLITVASTSFTPHLGGEKVLNSSFAIGNHQSCGRR